MSRLVPDLLRSAADLFPEKVAVVDGDRRVTYRELFDQAAAMSGRLAASGLDPGERVLILLENSPEYIVSLFAVARSGAIAVPVGHQVPDRGLRKILADCAPSVAIGHAGKMESRADSFHGSSIRIFLETGPTEFRERRRGSALRRVPEGKERDVALILYTSGTAGQPKGVMLTHRNLLANAASIVDYLKLTAADRGMAILPFHYSYGNSLLTTHVMAGATLVLQNSFAFPNVALDRIREEAVTGFAGVPSTFAVLLNRSNLRKRVFPSLRYVTQAGGAMSPALARGLREALPGVEIYIMYGQTEATARLTYLEPSDLIRKAGSVGKAIPGVRITLRREDGSPVNPGEVGEIVAEGDNVMAGYWNSPGETAAILKDGCLRTGDLAREDEEGYLYIVGRRSEMIKTGGHRASPKEIEEVIHGMPGVLEAAVVGVPDDMLGQAIRAFVACGPEGTVSAKELLRYCSERLEPFLVPHEVVFLGELPKSASGKVDRAELKRPEFRQSARAGSQP